MSPSTTLAFHFPWRRYHATPWGRYVNEGAVEMPPSPWRILRALYAVWKQRRPTLSDGTEIDEETVHGLLALLAGADPTYALPPYQISHTRHYYPDAQHRSGSPSNDLALDAFAGLDGDATIRARWPIELNSTQEQALEKLLASLPYLGRADSICDARLEHDWAPDDVQQIAQPLLEPTAEHCGPEQQLAELLTPATPLDLDSLLLRPVEIRAKKLVYPPSTRRTAYAVPRPRRQPPQQASTAPRSQQRCTTVMLSVLGTPQPRMTDTVAVTDALRRTCLKSLPDKAPSSALVGKEEDGSRSRSNHGHAHFLAIPSLEDSNVIGRLAIWAPKGLTAQDLEALRGLSNRTVSAPHALKSAPHDLRVRVLAQGDEKILPDGLTTRSSTWTSLTPFVPTRHYKSSQDWHTYVRDNITKELAHRGITTPVHVTTLPEKAEDFVLYRRRRLPGTHTTRASERAETRDPLCLRLEFEEPIHGPNGLTKAPGLLALGALAHFGLGLFHPITG